jgi:hypothetical protein
MEFAMLPVSHVVRGDETQATHHRRALVMFSLDLRCLIWGPGDGQIVGKGLRRRLREVPSLPAPTGPA